MCLYAIGVKNLENCESYLQAIAPPWFVQSPPFDSGKVRAIAPLKPIDSLPIDSLPIAVRCALWITFGSRTGLRASNHNHFQSLEEKEKGSVRHEPDYSDGT